MGQSQNVMFELSRRYKYRNLQTGTGVQSYASNEIQIEIEMIRQDSYHWHRAKLKANFVMHDK